MVDLTNLSRRLSVAKWERLRRFSSRQGLRAFSIVRRASDSGELSRVR
jgi:hypothetical protein